MLQLQFGMIVLLEAIRYGSGQPTTAVGRGCSCLVAIAIVPALSYHQPICFQPQLTAINQYQ